MADGFASVSPRRQIPSTDPRGNFTELLLVEALGKNLQHLALKNTRQFELRETKNSGYIVPLQVESGWKNSKSSPSLFGPNLKTRVAWMYISLTDSRIKRFRKWSNAWAPEIDPEIDKDVRADEGDGEIIADPDLDKRVRTSPERPHQPWLVPGAGRL
jgi:hypothetical protein